MRRIVLLWLTAFLSLSLPSLAAPLDIYIDADFSKSKSSSSAIELGVRTALEEVGYQLGGMDVRVLPKDHRGNVKRSRKTLEEFNASDTSLALVGGMHSPPYLAHREYINENGLLTLLTWSAAGPITRAPKGMENWIYRLSVDDRRSGGFLVDSAVSNGKCKEISLVLMDTSWGHANREPLVAALEAWNMAPKSVEFFSSSVGEAAAGTLAATIASQSPDCLILLASWDSGAIVVNALHRQLPDVKIFSHWGIMGGSFPQEVPHEVRAAHHLSVLQTCGLEREREGNPILSQALSRALPDSPHLASLPAPTGFVHGYDFMRLLISAADQAAQTPDWQGDIRAKRRALRQALETLQTPVTGILKTYSAPFSAYTPNRPDAHEALGPSDLCLARFAENGALEDIR